MTRGSDVTSGADQTRPMVLRARADDPPIEVDVPTAPGQVTVLVGPNGAGKSATFAALLGHLGGAAHPPPVGWLPQRGGLLPRLAPAQQVARFARSGDPLGTVDDVLRALDLDPADRRRPERLSVGEAQRVGVARALLAAPLALLDEPTSAQDVVGATAVRRLVRRYAEAGGAAVLASHTVEDAHVVADVIVVVEAGRVTQSGTAVALASDPGSAYVARVVGATVLDGTVRDRRLAGPWGELVVADGVADGPAIATIKPSAVTLHRNEPRAASPRNAFRGTVTALTGHADAITVHVATAPPLVAAVTQAAVEELDLHVGAHVWAVVKANEITVTPA